MTFFKATLFILFTFSFNATADPSAQNDANESVQTSYVYSNLTALVTNVSQYFTSLFDDWFNQPPKLGIHTIATVETQESKSYDVSIANKISQLEKRRIAMEEKRLAAEEKRLVAAERRLAAAEKRLTAEEARLSAERKKLLINNNPTDHALSNNLQSQKTAGVKEKYTGLPISTTTMAKKDQKKLKSVVSTTKNPAFIKLENQYYLDLYKWELKTEIYRLVKYPDWAKSLGKKGSVKLNFTVDRRTSVSNVNGDNPNISIQLISELHRAITVAAKRVLPPDALPGDNWEMDITYNFQPNSKQQAIIEKPNKPLFLEREHSTVLISSENNLEKYQEDIQDIINDRIEYPVWAEKLNQKGRVSFEITINKDGSISEITPKEVNRHLFLNEEVLKAINESSPLPSIPEHLRLHSTNMVIGHDFKKK